MRLCISYTRRVLNYKHADWFRGRQFPFICWENVPHATKKVNFTMTAKEEEKNLHCHLLLKVFIEQTSTFYSAPTYRDKSVFLLHIKYCKSFIVGIMVYFICAFSFKLNQELGHMMNKLSYTSLIIFLFHQRWKNHTASIVL